MADVIKFETQQFTGRAGNSTSPPSLFGNVRANICSAAGTTGVAVLYAGREVDLGDLLESLEHRACRGTPLTIMTAGLELGKVLRGKDLRATTKDVRTQLLNINTRYVVRGASGTLSFSKTPSGEDTGGTGVPEGKPIPVLQYPNQDDPLLPSRQVGRFVPGRGRARAGPLWMTGRVTGPRSPRAAVDLPRSSLLLVSTTP